MGEPKQLRKLREHPQKPKSRLKEEAQLLRDYAIKTKRTIYGIRYQLKQIKSQAKRLLAAQESKELETNSAKIREKDDFLQSLDHRNLIHLPSQSLEDVLGLTEADMFDKQLVTFVLKKGYAQTAKQARQMIVHGHILLRGRAITIPSFVPRKKDYDEITIRSSSIYHRRWTLMHEKQLISETGGAEQRKIRRLRPLTTEREVVSENNRSQEGEKKV